MMRMRVCSLVVPGLVLVAGSCDDKASPVDGDASVPDITDASGDADRDADAGDGSGGDAGAAPGPLRVHPDNPRYFTDDSGRAIYLTGSHTWYLIHYNDSNPQKTDDAFAAYLDWMQSFGHNFIRLWTGWANNQPKPWLRTGPGTASDGLPKFDMTQIDPSYLELVRRRVTMIEQRGMVCSVMFFGSGIAFHTSGWSGMAWHPDNNVNAELATAFDPSDGLSFFTTEPAALEIERGFVRHFVDALNDVDHLLWEIINEAGGSPESVAWQQAMVDYVHQYESSLPQQHLVGITGGYEFGEAMLEGPADWISPDWDAYRLGGPAEYVGKIVLNDTDHIPGWGFSEPAEADNMRSWVWQTFTRGHHPIFMDSYDATVAGQAATGTIDPVFDPVRRAMGCTLELAGSLVDLASMTPSESVSSSGYALVADGGEIVAYQPESGATFTVAAPAGEYRYEWIDPTSCASLESGTVVVGGSPETFEPPASDDAALVLRPAGP